MPKINAESVVTDATIPIEPDDLTPEPESKKPSVEPIEVVKKRGRKNG